MLPSVSSPTQNDVERTEAGRFSIPKTREQSHQCFSSARLVALMLPTPFGCGEGLWPRPEFGVSSRGGPVATPRVVRREDRRTCVCSRCRSPRSLRHLSSSGFRVWSATALLRPRARPWKAGVGCSWSERWSWTRSPSPGRPAWTGTSASVPWWPRSRLTDAAESPPSPVTRTSSAGFDCPGTSVPAAWSWTRDQAGRRSSRRPVRSRWAGETCGGARRTSGRAASRTCPIPRA